MQDGTRDNNYIARDTVEIFQSQANDVADIRLTLWTDSTFNFYLRTLPQPMSNEEETVVRSTGIWTKEPTMTRLIFLKDRPIINAVFDESYDKKNSFTVINDSTVDINSNANEIWIWGVSCLKKQY